MALNPSVRQVDPVALNSSLGPVVRLSLGRPIHDKNRLTVPIGPASPLERGVAPKADRNSLLGVTGASEQGLVITVPEDARLFPLRRGPSSFPQAPLP